MNDILRYQGLYGDQQMPFVSDFIHMEPLQERSKIYAWEIQEHFHTDLVQLFVIESSNGILFSEEQQIRLQAPCLVTVPANVLHGFHFEPEVKGDVLTLSISFFDTLFKDRPQLKNESNQLVYYQLENTYQTLEDIVYLKSRIQQELLMESPEKLMALTTYFELIYLQLYREQFRTTANSLISNNKNLKYFQKFQDLIRQNTQNILSIKDFAKTIGITQTHLNRVCHVVADKSALKVVQDYSLNEAKKYLLNTSYTVAEISYFLNYNDPAYFNRLFKKRVGVTPGEFRKS